MPTPTSSSEIILVGSNGDSLIDALTTNGEKWKSPVITYSFPDYGSLWSTDLITGYGPNSDTGSEPWSLSFLPISSSDQIHFVEALQRWEDVANIEFKFTQETSNNVGDIRAAFTHSDTLSAAAWTYFGANRSVFNGDIWFDREGSAANEIWEPGTFSFMIVMHEIGHALGLDHPFEDSSFPVSLDTISKTIMSYSAIAGNQNSDFTFEPTTPMPLDISAIQYLYGPNNNYHSGNDSYSFGDSQTYHETIWDSGGINDLLSYTGIQDSSIDLREGMGSIIGNAVYALDANTENLIPNIWIAYDAVIENAQGGSGADLLTGNDVDNHLDGGAGNDQLYGGGGNDVFDWESDLRGGNDEMHGGPGNDTYVTDSLLDIIIESPGEGIDTIWAFETYSIENISSVENLYLSGEQSINATGNDLDNELRGNEQDNLLTGNAGNDDLDGQRGDDMLLGGNGNDILRAGYGHDILDGGAGRDIFGFYAPGYFQISDLTIGEDNLFFDEEKIGISNLNDLVGNITNISQKDDGVIVEFGPSASIELVGINLNDINADMVLFAL
ncbi:MAG: M10 family metallopeptidase [Sediminibacterium sp.]|uniref:M10 family metallopeptidase n=1 Tax=Sediminibacterium sp. TaxID=1917865 RepID=UPI0027237C4C|nr:M10 family metallopeptidase [Sediminibacterium sp.]MDO8995174.1 M10 family metallopeptidase [Sediminibacterium sp.]